MMTRGSGLDRRLRRAAEGLAVVLVLSGAVFAFPMPTVRGATGGPDAFGYDWTDSNAPPPQVEFTWEEISGSGTLVDSWAEGSDDSWAGPFSLGFDFTFYGISYTEVFVGTNGYLSFGEGHARIPAPGEIPSEMAPNNVVMPYGTDLWPGAADPPGGVYYEMRSSPNRFIVEFSEVPHFPGEDNVTFQVTLYETGEVWFEYLSLTGFADAVGIENADGSIGLPYPAEGLMDSLAIRFVAIPRQVDLSPRLQSIVVIAGEVGEAGLVVTNNGTADDTIDLSFASPNNWTAAFYEDDGSTPLADTDSDGVPDTGLLPPTGDRDIVLVVVVPGTASGTERITITANSSVDESVSTQAIANFRVLAIIVAPETDVSPVINGTIEPDEWTDAHVVDLFAIPGNVVPASLMVMMDSDFLYVAYDAIGDVTSDAMDAASISFDTDNDGIPTDGREDQFVQGGWAPNNQSHHVYDENASSWIVEDSPYDPGLPNHSGLASAWGFGASPDEAADHRMYEFRIPLALLGAVPGDTLGFFGGSNPAPGVVDWSVLGWSSWPEFVTGPIPLADYGDLALGDSIRPTIRITSPGLGAVLNVDSVALMWIVSDIGVGIDRFEVRVDGGDPTLLPGNATGHTVPDLSDGQHSIVVTAFDGAGNNRSDAVTIYVDTTAPSLTIDSPSDGALLGTSTLSVEWTANDATTAIAQFRIRLDLGVIQSLSGTARSHAFMAVPDGPHRVTLTAVDDAGNEATSAVNLTIDATAPAVAIISPAEGANLGTGSVSITWTAVDGTSSLAGFQIRLDADAPEELPGSARSHTFAAVSDGSHTVDLIAIDSAGNEATDTVTVTVDTTDPTLSISRPAQGSTLTSNSVRIEWTAADATSQIDRIEVSVDGAPVQTLEAGTTSLALAGLSDGEHSVEVTVVDRAGNSVSRTVAFRVDTSFFSPSGPLGPYGLIGIVIATVALLGVGLALWRIRRRKSP